MCVSSIGSAMGPDVDIDLVIGKLANMLSLDVVKALATSAASRSFTAKAPRSHFPARWTEIWWRDGVCGVSVARSWQSAAHGERHLKVLSRAGCARQAHQAVDLSTAGRAADRRGKRELSSAW